jgi:hypothetical protein
MTIILNHTIVPAREQLAGRSLFCKHLRPEFQQARK